MSNHIVKGPTAILLGGVLYGPGDEITVTATQAKQMASMLKPQSKPQPKPQPKPGVQRSAQKASKKTAKKG